MPVIFTGAYLSTAASMSTLAREDCTEERPVTDPSRVCRPMAKFGRTLRSAKFAEPPLRSTRPMSTRSGASSVSGRAVCLARSAAFARRSASGLRPSDFSTSLMLVVPSALMTRSMKGASASTLRTVRRAPAPE